MSGTAAVDADGRIQLPPVPASSSRVVKLVASIFSGSPAANEHGQQRWRLRWALAVSVMLHLLALAALAAVIGAAAARLPASSTAGGTLIAASLRPASGQPGLVRSAAPARESPAPGREEVAVAELAAVSPDGAKVVALGQRRLAAHLPPYLAAPPVLDVQPGPWYFRATELTRAAALQEAPVLAPPPAAAGQRLPAGKVVLRVLIGATGDVDRVDVAGSSLPPDYEAAAVAAFAPLRFRPGEIEGVPVSSELRLEVSFEAGDNGRSHAAGAVGAGEPGLPQVPPAASPVPVPRLLEAGKATSPSPVGAPARP